MPVLMNSEKNGSRPQEGLNVSLGGESLNVKACLSLLSCFCFADLFGIHRPTDSSSA